MNTAATTPTLEQIDAARDEADRRLDTIRIHQSQCPPATNEARREHSKTNDALYAEWREASDRHAALVAAYRAATVLTPEEILAAIYRACPEDTTVYRMPEVTDWEREFTFCVLTTVDGSQVQYLYVAKRETGYQIIHADDFE